MSTGYFTPHDRTAAVELSQHFFRKQIAPLGQVNYRDRTGVDRSVNFDQAYFQKVIDAYKRGAMDQVPIQLAAPGTNKHNMDVDKFAGDVVGLEITDQGLEAIVSATDKGAAMIRDNPKLGASVAILENETRGGKTWPALLQHVLLTLDPVAKGMQPWKEVALANQATETIDLTEGVTMTDPAPQPDLDPQTDPVTDPVTEPVVEAPDFTPTAEEQALAEQVFSEMVANGELEDPDADDDESEEDGAVTELQTATNLANEERISALEIELAQTRWANEAAVYIDAGVPPALIELAAPVLSNPSPAVIELSNSETVDASDVIRKLLQQSRGFVELSRERGTSFNSSDSEEEREAELLKNWKVQ